MALHRFILEVLVNAYEGWLIAFGYGVWDWIID